MCPVDICISFYSSRPEMSNHICILFYSSRPEMVNHIHKMPVICSTETRSNNSIRPAATGPTRYRPWSRRCAPSSIRCATTAGMRCAAADRKPPRSCAKWRVSVEGVWGDGNGGGGSEVQCLFVIMVEMAWGVFVYRALPFCVGSIDGY